MIESRCAGQLIEREVNSCVTKSSRNRFVPHPTAEGAHTVFRRDPLTGKVTHYETYQFQTNLRNPNPWESVVRFDNFCSENYHFNKITKERVFEPHIHDPNSVGSVRRAYPWEMPL